jgi:hypothetical protein
MPVTKQKAISTRRMLRRASAIHALHFFSQQQLALMVLSASLVAIALAGQEPRPQEHIAGLAVCDCGGLPFPCRPAAFAALLQSNVTAQLSLAGFACKPSDIQRGSIALAVRGKCTFAQKVRSSIDGGAMGIIVANTEDEHMVMMNPGSPERMEHAAVSTTAQVSASLREGIAECSVLHPSAGCMQCTLQYNTWTNAIVAASGALGASLNKDLLAGITRNLHSRVELENLLTSVLTINDAHKEHVLRHMFHSLVQERAALMTAVLETPNGWNSQEHIFLNIVILLKGIHSAVHEGPVKNDTAELLAQCYLDAGVVAARAGQHLVDQQWLAKALAVSPSNLLAQMYRAENLHKLGQR